MAMMKSSQMPLRIFVLAIFACHIVRHEASSIVNEFNTAIENEKYFLAMFTEPCCDCKECLDLEGILKVISIEMKLKFAKIVDEIELTQSYGIQKTPTLLFIRNKKAILYTGKITKDDVADWISTQPESFVKNLDDESFEHLTQASTGATTGDWITFFCSSSSYGCRSIEAKVEAIGSRLSRKMNTAIVDIDKSPKLKKRFNIKSVPTILFFRFGKYYVYDLKSLKLDIKPLMTFAEGSYKNYQAVPVPTPKSPFDELVEEFVIQLKTVVEEKPTVLYSALGASLGLSLLLCLFCRTTAPKTTKSD